MILDINRDEAVRLAASAGLQAPSRGKSVYLTLGGGGCIRLISTADRGFQLYAVNIADLAPYSSPMNHWHKLPEVVTYCDHDTGKIARVGVCDGCHQIVVWGPLAESVPPGRGRGLR